MSMQELELDPRWDWFDIRTMGDPGPVWIKVRCRHSDIVPVESVTGGQVAQLCLTCDSQLPAAPEHP
jgi:hypothetical protein